jgi:hypothetical protein
VKERSGSTRTGASRLLRRRREDLSGASISDLLPGSIFGPAADPALRERGVLRRAVHLPERAQTLDIVACRAGDAIAINLKESSFETLARRVRQLATRLDLAASVAELGFWEWDIQNDRLDWVDDREAVIAVRDTGVGLEPNELEWVFEPFTRAATTEGGLGIGLMVVRALVQLHGGSVSARSDGRGRGSEFIVRLPLVEVAEATTNGDQPDLR